MNRQPHTSSSFPYTPLFRSLPRRRRPRLPRRPHLHLRAGERLEAQRVGAALVDPEPAQPRGGARRQVAAAQLDRKSTRLNSSHLVISYAVFCLKKKNKKQSH